MPTYLFSYRMPADYVSTADTRAGWAEFFQTVSTQLEDIGAPIFARDCVGETGPRTVLGGYTMIDAASLQQAAALAERCPLMDHGGGVEVGELTPPDSRPTE